MGADAVDRRVLVLVVILAPRLHLFFYVTLWRDLFAEPAIQAAEVNNLPDVCVCALKGAHGTSRSFVR